MPGGPTPLDSDSALTAAGDRTTRAWWSAIILTAIVIRLPFALESGLTGDEANYVLIAQCAAGDILTGAALDPSNPPLFMLALHGLMNVVGDRIWAYRLMTVVMNVAGIVLMTLLFRRWVGAKAAVLAGLLAAMHPWQTYMATEVRGYALAGVCAAAALEAGDRFERKGSVSAVACWALACAAGFWTHYSMAVVALVTGVYTLVRIRRNRRHVLAWCLAGSAAAAIMLLWLPLMLRQQIHPGAGPAHFWHLAGLPIIQCLGTTYLRPAISLTWMVIGGLAAAIVYGLVGLMGIAHLFRVHRRALLLVIGLLAATVVVPVARSVAIGSLAFSARYTFVANVTALLLLACGLTALRPRPRRIAMICIIALSCVSLAQLRWVYVGRSLPAEMTAKAQAEIPDGEAVLFPHVVDALRARFYAGGGFPHAFVQGSEAGKVGFLRPGATWRDVADARFYRPETFFTREARAQLHTFGAVWYLQSKRSDALPPVLGTAYQLDRIVTLAPGGQFGQERPLRLIRFCRIASAPAPSNQGA